MSSCRKIQIIDSHPGGASFNSFLVMIRRTAMSNVPQQELAALQPAFDSWIEPAPKLRKPKKERTFVKNWQMSDLVGDLDKASKGRSFAQGQSTTSPPSIPQRPDDGNRAVSSMAHRETAQSGRLAFHARSKSDRRPCLRKPDDFASARPDFR